MVLLNFLKRFKAKPEAESHPRVLAEYPVTTPSGRVYSMLSLIERPSGVRQLKMTLGGGRYAVLVDAKAIPQIREACDHFENVAS